MDKLTIGELLLLVCIHRTGNVNRKLHLNYDNDVFSLMKKRCVIRKRGNLTTTIKGAERVKSALNAEVFEVEVRVGSKVSDYFKDIAKKGYLGDKKSKHYKLAKLIAEKKYKANV